MRVVTSRASTKTGSSVKSTTPSVKPQTPIPKSTTISPSIRHPQLVSPSSSRPSSRGSTHSTARSRLTISTNKTGTHRPHHGLLLALLHDPFWGGAVRPISTTSTAMENTSAYRTASTKSPASTPTARTHRTSQR